MSIFEDPEEWVDYDDEYQFSTWCRLRLRVPQLWKKPGFLFSPRRRSKSTFHYKMGKTPWVKVQRMIEKLSLPINPRELTPAWHLKIKTMNMLENRKFVVVGKCKRCGGPIPVDRYLSLWADVPKYCSEKCCKAQSRGQKKVVAYREQLVPSEPPKGLMEWGADIRPAAPGVLANSPEFDPMTFTPVEIAMEREGFTR